MTGLDTPLTPLQFLERSAQVHPNKTAIVDGQRRLSYSELASTVTRLAHGLRRSGVGSGDRVAYLATNSAELLAAHYAVPLIGAALVAINTRLSAPEIEYICNHSEAVLLLGEPELLTQLHDVSLTTVRELIQLPQQDGSYTVIEQAHATYDELMARGTDEPLPWGVDDETRTISINYTSGTTGRPKGVMYTHRGAYLNSLSQIHHQHFDLETKYLWTLPMFHCNGWCGPWAVTAACGTHVCIRAVRGDAMWSLIDNEQIDHMSGAPTVLTTLATADAAHPLDRRITITTAGAPPSPTTIRAVRALGAEIVHVYGLTETYGPCAVCEPQADWAGLGEDMLATRLARQGVGMLASGPVRVVRAQRGARGELLDVANDGTEMGEIVMRGNIVMKGYFGDEAGTAEAFSGGWFHSGDLGVMHPDSYVQLMDRAKDIVISGGENISTIEVEQVLMSHPSVLDVAVIGVPDAKWGERPKAFVVLKRDAGISDSELMQFVRDRIAAFKAPREFMFLSDLPKTSTGKIRKNELRDREWHGERERIRG
ncbi:AMP-binding protein [Rhodococcus sp. NPDC056960]|uniref:AMP-binding protein n=1 Tax=Rhodococcus sp. NPDC056960 TaxID=3345982 RepID=UPI00363F927B